MKLRFVCIVVIFICLNFLLFWTPPIQYTLYSLLFWVGSGYLFNRGKIKIKTKSKIIIGFVFYLIGFLTIYGFGMTLDNYFSISFALLVSWNLPSMTIFSYILKINGIYDELSKFYISSLGVNTLYLSMFFLGQYFYNLRYNKGKQYS